MKGAEKRLFNISNLEIRDGNKRNGESTIIEGYAAIFNSKTTIGDDWWTEEIAPGAFSDAIAEGADVRALINHDWNMVLGRTKSGTLKLEEDDRGLKFTVEIPDTSYAQDLVKSMERGDINQCSFGFYVKADEWDYETEPTHRIIKDVELFEVSIVTFPAYEDTEASVRSKEINKKIEKQKQLIKKIDDILGGK